MKKLLTIAVLIASMAGCDSNTNEIKIAQAIVKAELLDGESAQFTDPIFYKTTNYVCGQVNAKNRLGGYAGARRFIVSLAEKTNHLDPDRETPSSPSSPSSMSAEVMMNNALETAAWAAKVQKTLTEKETFDRLNEEKCTDTPSKEKQKNGSPESKPMKQESYQRFAFDLNLKKIPIDFSGDDLSTVSNKVKTLTKGKNKIETTDEFNKRMSILSFDPSPESFEKLYAIKFDNTSFDITDSIVFDADKSKVSIKYSGNLTDGLCHDNRIQAHKKEHPVICYMGKGVYLSISNRSKFFLKTTIQRKNMFEKGEYDFIDSFTLPREKIAELPKIGKIFSDIGISTLLVGNIVKDQLNPQHSQADVYVDEGRTALYAVSGAVIPFNVQYVIYYSSSTGEILVRKDL